MNKSNVNNTKITSYSAADIVNTRRDQASLKPYAAYIGLDVHKDTIAVAIAKPGRQPAAYVKTIVRQGILLMPPFRPSEINDSELDALARYLSDKGAKG